MHAQEEGNTAMGETGDVPDPHNQADQPWQTPSPDEVYEPFARTALQPSHVATSHHNTRQRRIWLVTAGIGVLGISVLLAASLSSILLPPLQSLLSSRLFPAQGQTSNPANRRNTSAAADNATTTPLPPADWQSGVYSGPNYRFRMDMPIVLVCSHGYFINDFTGIGCDYLYAGAPTQTALQQVEVETEVEMLSSSKITDRNICPQGGTRVNLGSGADTTIGWERDQVSTSNSNGTVTVNLVLHGTPIQISLTGFGGEQQPFFERYGAIWRHMLASFSPLPAPITQLVHPCG